MGKKTYKIDPETGKVEDIGTPAIVNRSAEEVRREWFDDDDIIFAGIDGEAVRKKKRGKDAPDEYEKGGIIHAGMLRQTDPMTWELKRKKTKDNKGKK